ncbi:MAG: FeoB-associated Cys-rich membrane protein [Lachnospiraceae bacterium]|nr:FeoB-associated Cys-rich membrane protein [Lachnospiraceae bacterium]
MTLGTAVVSAALVAICALIIRYMVKENKKSKASGGCSGSCAGCTGCSHRI